MKQYTYMMLKPDAFENGKKEKIIEVLEKHGLHIEQSCVLEVDMEIMKSLLDHYLLVIEEKGKEIDFTGKLFYTFYYDGPKYIMPMKVVYEGDEDIISYSRQLVGKTNPVQADPKSIRGLFSDDSYEKADQYHRLVNNVIHASDSYESVKRELAIWEKYLNQ